ncbi:pancreatic lipase-related protein 2-like isoform X2 [Scaptodrosophila lebanonensis]|uniref:Pancreatic lipase-related protein 2-like isoform X2 n=1 Tax=Drosophila lebanonensis TaxID=7225 RepID=A0A6J2T7M7_DROLE|nr:pancreatic lipase-related protein 2-like isoform X2 [Scaptodrosophila lebanonensis]
MSEGCKPLRHSGSVSFYLFTNENSSNAVAIKATENSIRNSKFNKDHGTRILIHGWTETYKNDGNFKLTNALLSKSDYNVIAVNWGDAKLWYGGAFKAVPHTGAKVGAMIKYLHETHGMSLNTLHIIGFSLGAHIAGHAGRTVGPGKVHTIIGLDPALFLYYLDKPQDRLTSSDAFYVECIHTNAGVTGLLEPIGSADFYPNGGQNQPHCLFGCAHALSITYYVEALIWNNFGSYHCESYHFARQNNCNHEMSNVRMGDPANANVAKGVYWVPVNEFSPYGVSSFEAWTELGPKSQQKNANGIMMNK